MKSKTFEFRGVVTAHEVSKKFRIIVIAQSEEIAQEGAIDCAKKFCESLCEHATYKFTKRKEIKVDAIVETIKRPKIDSIIGEVIGDIVDDIKSKREKVNQVSNN